MNDLTNLINSLFAFAAFVIGYAAWSCFPPSFNRTFNSHQTHAPSSSSKPSRRARRQAA